MDYNIIKDKNTGFTTLLIPNQSTEAVTSLLLAKAGSRYENKSISGLSHFIEHMFFKGGKRFTSTKEVSEIIDGIGGEFNAFTGKEYAGYYIKVAKDNLNISLDVLSDMMINATFPEKEFFREQQVILEEINMYEDNPIHKASMSFEQLMFGDHPLGWDIAGTKELVASFDRDTLIKYKKERYVPENLILIISGNFDEKTIKETVDSYFQFEPEKSSSDWKPFQSFPTERINNIKKPIEQTNVVVGVPTVALTHEDKYALQLLSIILGGNMSSRMFMNIREAKGLCYYIYSGADFFFDTGYFATYAGIDSTRTEDAIDAIKKEYENIGNDLNQDEIDRAISFTKGKLTLQLEDSEERASFLGKQLLLEGKIESLENILEKMQSISRARLIDTAKKYFRDYRVVTVGPNTKAGN